MNPEIKPMIKKCPCCAEVIEADALKCKHCGEWVKKPSPNTTMPRVSALQFSNVQPVWQFVLLSVATLGIYEVYWFYRNWKQPKVHKNLDISPGWRTAGLFIPIYGLMLAYRQLEDIKNFAITAGIDKTYSSGWVLVGWIFFSILGLLPGPFGFLGLLSVWPLTIVQQVLNSYWTSEQSELPHRTKFSGKQIVLLVIGGAFLILAVIGTFIPE
jgi:hypothetical protein